MKLDSLTIPQLRRAIKETKIAINNYNSPIFFACSAFSQTDEALNLFQEFYNIPAGYSFGIMADMYFNDVSLYSGYNDSVAFEFRVLALSSFLSYLEVELEAALIEQNKIRKYWRDIYHDVVNVMNKFPVTDPDSYGVFICNALETEEAVREFQSFFEIYPGFDGSTFDGKLRDYNQTGMPLNSEVNKFRRLALAMFGEYARLNSISK